MAPPSTKPRLAQLVPEQVAEEVARQALNHIVSLTMALLSPETEIRCAEEVKATQIYLTVRDLAYYATRGVELDADVHEYLISLVPLYQSVAGNDATVDGVSDEADPETPLGLVICAALARERLEDSRSISAVELAALASMSATQIRLLIRNGEIPARDGAISAKNATRFLQVRKVAGI